MYFPQKYKVRQEVIGFWWSVANENKQTKVDKILDKISKSGYDSLDKDEKEYLFKQGGKKWKI